MIVKGLVIDEFTRCVHYHSELDIIAIKLPCCGDFYPCYECHEETAGHKSELWKKEAWNEKAVLCGSCQYIMTITEYLECGYQCPSCNTPFNPKCANHNHLYFQGDE